MIATGLDQRAHDAVAGACAHVREPEPTDDVDGVAPALVACPADVGQVAEVLRATAAHGLTVVPRGRGTKLSWGRPPTRADVLLDVSSLDQVLDHAAGDLILAVQAGTRLAAVRDVVAAGGQRLVLDETVPGGTVGGALATNASGPRRLLAGTARDLLIGVTVVRADGVVAKAGGRVVKNVAGYDLGKLLVGSFGTLGVVVDATFRLHPVPAASRWVEVTATSPAAVHERVQTVLHSQVVPAAVEVTGGAGEWTVSVLLEGRPEGVDGRAEELRGLLGAEARDGDEPAPHPWDPTAGAEQRATALKATFGLSALATVLAELDRADASVAGSAGAGVVYAALPPDRAAPDVAHDVERVRAACTDHGGALVVLDAPGAVKEATDVWGPVPALGLMRRVKDQFDPGHRLSPGRFVGGI